MSHMNAVADPEFIAMQMLGGRQRAGFLLEPLRRRKQ